MRIRKGLLIWNLRELRNVTLVAVPVAVAYTILAPGHMGIGAQWQALFIIGYAIAVAVALGRYRTGQFGFLYGRGFGRDSLWFHAVLASIVGVLVVWLAASLVLWLGVRGFVQNLLESPYYPGIMEPRDALVPWTWLALFLFALPFVHYAWIRAGHAAPGGDGGKILAYLAMLGVLLMLDTRHLDPPGVQRVILAIAAGTWLVILLGSRLVHRRMEIQG
jgi:hypothetical protein